AGRLPCGRMRRGRNAAAATPAVARRSYGGQMRPLPEPPTSALPTAASKATSWISLALATGLTPFRGVAGAAPLLAAGRQARGLTGGRSGDNIKRLWLRRRKRASDSGSGGF